jgi:hypothetical protein
MCVTSNLKAGSYFGVGAAGRVDSLPVPQWNIVAPTQRGRLHSFHFGGSAPPRVFLHSLGSVRCAYGSTRSAPFVAPTAPLAPPRVLLYTVVASWTLVYHTYYEWSVILIIELSRL